MKNTLHSLIRIIIIGSFRSLVECHQPFLAIAPPPPYINAPVVEPIYHPPEAPVFYPDKTVYSLPLPYQNVDFLSLPQLFFQDQNYRPPSEERSHVAPPSKHYLVPPHQKAYQPPYSPPHKKTNILITHKKISPLKEVKQNFPINQKLNIRPQKEKVYPTLVYKKENISQPSHQETSNENLEDDYSYNYSDDLLPPAQSPLLNYPYQHFRPVKPNHVNNVQSFSSCLNPKTSHGNLEKASLDLKAPITFFPSRFPPRIEELLERIQNYFSTYTEQELQKPTKNITSPSPTTSVPETTVSESPLPIVSETVDTVGLSKPSQNKEPNQVNIKEKPESTVVVEMNDVEPVTQKVETIWNEPSENKFEEQISSTLVTDGPVAELNNNNKDGSAVYFPETTTTTTHNGNIRNQQEIISSYPYLTPTEDFYLSKNPTETIHAHLPAGEALDKSENVSPAISTLENGLKDHANHLDSYYQNLKTDLNIVHSEDKQNENRTAFHDVMTTTNEIDHSNLTNSS